ncbi:CDP-diacylglycerol--serine O-phosphatidyltransferase [Marinicellulosiphila megalodicopiae]|uniref:CDP-diacylglycerol--serine O-phosphatidyltransferase n=1 Tax=Marinicellulosiphila megalodicopiae TaxID=2724896 RepID=UPI003BAECEAF
MSDLNSSEITESSESQIKHRAKGVYILPNLATTSALFAGFYAIIAAIKGDFIGAAMAIFAAQVLDTLDGRIARMTNTQSDFGAEYDSLSDCISFGLAPALLAYQFALHSIDKLGWMVAFVYVAAGALRLARFNTQVGTSDKRFFIGLASPAAAAVIAGGVWLMSVYEIKGEDYSYYIAAVVAFVGILMVSNVRYFSFKVIGTSGKMPFVLVPLFLIVFALIVSKPEYSLTIMSITYVITGVMFEVYCFAKKMLAKKQPINDSK